ncbi:hypothetical protein RND81_02G018200 [Saponaria officinalis]|uniref:50S ribosomal protein L33, chloroplastic n=1 Tax=Saponaria officinalis TaxID=3572 RepID=A0AAW1MMK0_SAPOF
MATIFNLHKTSLINSPFLNNQQINQQFKLNPFSNLKFPPKFNFTQINCSHSKHSSIKPMMAAFEVSKPLLFGGAWGRGETGRREDLRAWSSRRPGSKSGGKKNRVTVALECTGCSGNRYTTEKRRVPTEKKENKKVKSSEGLLLNKYCPKCRKHFLPKEIKLGSSK